MRSQKPSDSFYVNTIPILRAVCGGVKEGMLSLVIWNKFDGSHRVHSRLMFRKISVNTQTITWTVLGNSSKNLWLNGHSKIRTGLHLHWLYLAWIHGLTCIYLKKMNKKKIGVGGTHGFGEVEWSKEHANTKADRNHFFLPHDHIWLLFWKEY